MPGFASWLSPVCSDDCTGAAFAHNAQTRCLHCLFSGIGGSSYLGFYTCFYTLFLKLSEGWLLFLNLFIWLDLPAVQVQSKGHSLVNRTSMTLLSMQLPSSAVLLIIITSHGSILFFLSLPPNASLISSVIYYYYLCWLHVYWCDKTPCPRKILETFTWTYSFRGMRVHDGRVEAQVAARIWELKYLKLTPKSFSFIPVPPQQDHV